MYAYIHRIVSVSNYRILCLKPVLYTMDATYAPDATIPDESCDKLGYE